jgi:hypothetical protein
MTPLETTFFYISMALCLALSVLLNLRRGLFSARVYLPMALVALVVEYGASARIRDV